MGKIHSRIVNTHDIKSNWDSNPDFIPEKGEIIIYLPTESYMAPRLKIGDGVNNILNLPYLISSNVLCYDLSGTTIQVVPADSNPLKIMINFKLTKNNNSNKIQLLINKQAIVLSDAVEEESVYGSIEIINLGKKLIKWNLMDKYIGSQLIEINGLISSIQLIGEDNNIESSNALIEEKYQYDILSAAAIAEGLEITTIGKEVAK